MGVIFKPLTEDDCLCGRTIAKTTDNLASLLALGNNIYLSQGTYNHADILTIDSFRVCGSKWAVLRSTNTTGDSPKNAVILTGTNPKLKGVTVTSAWVGERQSNDSSSGVLVSDATGFKVDNVDVDVSAGAGVLVRNSTGGAIVTSSVADTLSDGFHITGCSSDINVTGNVANTTGDDGFAVVSYVPQGVACSGITFTGNTSNDSAARGMSVVGGNSVVFNDNEVNRSNSSGIYIASEASFNTYGVDGVTGTGNLISDCNVGLVSGGSVYINGREGYIVQNVDLETNTILDSNSNGIVVASNNGNPSYTRNIRLATNTIKGKVTAVNSGIGIKMYRVTDIEIEGNNIEDFHRYGIYSDANVTAGSILIKDNHLENLNLSNLSYIDAINLSGGDPSFSFADVRGNKYVQGDNEIERFFQSGSGVPVLYVSTGIEANDSGGEPISIATVYEG